MEPEKPANEQGQHAVTGTSMLVGFVAFSPALEYLFFDMVRRTRTYSAFRASDTAVHWFWTCEDQCRFELAKILREWALNNFLYDEWGPWPLPLHEALVHVDFDAAAAALLAIAEQRWPLV